MGVQATQTEVFAPPVPLGAPADALVDSLHHPAKQRWSWPPCFTP